MWFCLKERSKVERKKRERGGKKGEVGGGEREGERQAGRQMHRNNTCCRFILAGRKMNDDNITFITTHILCCTVI